MTQSVDPGIIAYVRPSTQDIHLISPDSSGDRVLWSAPSPPGPWGVWDLDWRPDGRELAFSSDHEETCSWFQSDVYAIGFDGGGYRRVTNSPACAVLADLPKGSVTVDVSNWTWDPVWVYVQGAPGIQSISGDGTLVFDNVADLGPGVLQPPIGIVGLYRTTSSPPYAPLGTAIELLAGIPSIVYGIWGLFVFAPLFAEHVRLHCRNGWVMCP